MPPSVCAAHDLLVSNVQDVKKSTGDTYDLIREQAKEMSEMKLSIVKMEGSMIEFRAGQSATDDTLKRIEHYISRQSPRWTPKSIVSLVATLLGSGGVGAVAVMFIGK